ncbi:MAG: hypothetical protein RR054_03995 [Clostridia bacterium]
MEYNKTDFKDLIEARRVRRKYTLNIKALIIETLIVLLVVFALAALGYWSFTLYATSPIISIAIGAVVFFLFIIMVLYLHYQGTIRAQDSLLVYERETLLRGVDYMFCADEKQRIMLDGYNHYYECKIDLPSQLSKEDISNARHTYCGLVYWTYVKKSVLAGFDLDIENKVYTLGVYTPDNNADKWIEPFLKNNGYKQFKLSHNIDEQWNSFQKFIPTQEEFDNIADTIFVEELENAHFDFTKEAIQICSFTFLNSDNAKAFMDEAKKRGYINVTIETIVETDIEKQLVKYEMSGYLGINRVHLYTKEAKEFAGEYNGEYISREIKP